MNDREQEDFEKVLRGARPSETPAGLWSRIESEILGTNDAQPKNVIKASGAFEWFGPLSAAAVVAISAFSLILFFRPSGENLSGNSKGIDDPGNPRGVEIQRGWQPVSAGNIVEDTHDEGIILDRNGVPSRRIRYEFTDNYRWVHPESGAVIEFSIPQESRFVVPVQTD